jgi:hypothetical protein
VQLLVPLLLYIELSLLFMHQITHIEQILIHGFRLSPVTSFLLSQNVYSLQHFLLKSLKFLFTSYDKRQRLTHIKMTNKIIVCYILICSSKREIQDAAPEKHIFLSHGKKVKNSNKVRKWLLEKEGNCNHTAAVHLRPPDRLSCNGIASFTNCLVQYKKKKNQAPCLNKRQMIRCV